MIEGPDLSVTVDGPLIIVDAEAYQKLLDEHAELVAALEFIVRESDDKTVADHAVRVLRRLGLRD